MEKIQIYTNDFILYAPDSLKYITDDMFSILNDLKHGSSFVNEEYNGYKLSLLAVKYLYDNLDFEDFKMLLSDTKKVEEYGLNVLNDTIYFYKEKLNIGKSL